MLVLYKEDLIIISLKINLFSTWYSLKIAQLAINNWLIANTVHNWQNTFQQGVNTHEIIFLKGKIRGFFN